MKDKIWLQEMCELVKHKVPEGYGFIVFAFPFNESGRMFYASNGQRDDCVVALKGWLDQQADPQAFGKHTL